MADATGVDVLSDPIRIVLADDHALIRSGLRRVLDGEADLAVVGEAGDVEAALALTERHQPQVVVLDLNMPGTPTLAAIPRFLEASPGSAVVVLTMEAEPGFARTALSAGARGYVLKDAAEAELIEAVRSVLAGGTYLDPSLGARLARMGLVFRATDVTLGRTVALKVIARRRRQPCVPRPLRARVPGGRRSITPTSSRSTTPARTRAC